MALIHLINNLKKEYLFKQVFRFYPAQNDSITESTLKEYYLKWRDENRIPHRCDNHRCILHKKNPRWNGKKIVLEVNHIDGEALNWRLKNLRLLCPNCQSQTNNSHVREIIIA